MCNKFLLQLFNDLAHKLENYYVENMGYFRKLITKQYLILSLLLYNCVRPREYKLIVIDPWRGRFRRPRSDWLELRGTMIYKILRKYYIQDTFSIVNSYDPDMHKVHHKTVERLSKQILGVQPRVARLACAADLACNESVDLAAKYYDVDRNYLAKLLRSASNPLEKTENNPIDGNIVYR